MKFKPKFNYSTMEDQQRRHDEDRGKEIHGVMTFIAATQPKDHNFIVLHVGPDLKTVQLGSTFPKPIAIQILKDVIRPTENGETKYRDIAQFE